RRRNALRVRMKTVRASEDGTPRGKTTVRRAEPSVAITTSTPAAKTMARATSMAVSLAQPGARRRYSERSPAMVVDADDRLLEVGHHALEAHGRRAVRPFAALALLDPIAAFGAAQGLVVVPNDRISHRDDAPVRAA